MSLPLRNEFFFWDELDSQKRTKVPKLPTMAKITDPDDRTYDLFILANVMAPSTRTQRKLLCHLGSGNALSAKLLSESSLKK